MNDSGLFAWIRFDCFESNFFIIIIYVSKFLSTLYISELIWVLVMGKIFMTFRSMISAPSLDLPGFL